MVLNAAIKGKKERIGKLFQMHSNKENPVEEAHAGHIFAFIGLKGRHHWFPVRPGLPDVLESMIFLPAPVIHVAIEPAMTKGDRRSWCGHPEASGGGLQLTVSSTRRPGQTVIGGGRASST